MLWKGRFLLCIGVVPSANSSRVVIVLDVDKFTEMLNLMRFTDL